MINKPSTVPEMIEAIEKLKREKNVLVLVHNYQPLEIHSIADITGDSLQLAREAADTDAEIILLCGVRFMAETAKLLSPKAKVLLSHSEAGCPMADMITADQLREFKAEYPGSVVVCYVNSTVEVKAESDICCTSSNAVKVVNSIPRDKKVLFVPDQNLGTFTAEKTGREIVVWKGFCSVHHVNISVEDVQRAREEYPGWTLVVHPECKPEVFHLADMVTSTKGMADFVSENDKVILGTEVGLYEQLKQRFPDKKLLPLSKDAICKNMKKSTLAGILNVLDREQDEILISDSVAKGAMRSLQRMLSII